MKKLIYLLVLAFGLSFSLNAQTELTLENPVVKIENTTYQLIGFTFLDEPIFKITKYYEDGNIQQTGNIVGDKKDGVWLMYGHCGDLIAEMKYSQGIKIYLINYTNIGKSIIEYNNNIPHKHIQIAFLK